MGAAGLIEIKRRIKSVESTRKITKAMGLVATSKLRRVRKELTANQKYTELTKEIVDEVVNSLPENYKSVYFSEGYNADRLYIVLTSDMGLCGGYNNNVISFLHEEVEALNSNYRIVIVGVKGISYLNRYRLSTTGQYVDMPDIPTIKEIKKIYNDALFMYKNGEVSEVNIVFTEFLSPVKQQVKSIKILPVEVPEQNFGKYIIEPNIDVVFTNAMDMYIKSQLMTCMLNSKASEQSSRMTAMDSATENANDILHTLKIKFNRIRQSIITQEISEIVGGAEAQK